MYDFCDVLKASRGSADVKTHVLRSYGQGDMGRGIRRLADEALEVGKRMGNKEGVKKGVFATAGSTAIILIGTMGIKRIIKLFAEKKALKHKFECEADQQKQFIYNENIERLAEIKQNINDFLFAHLKPFSDEEKQQIVSMYREELRILKTISEL